MVLGGKSRIGMYEDKRKKKKAWRGKKNMNKLKQKGKKMNGKRKKRKKNNLATHPSLHDRSDTEVAASGALDRRVWNHRRATCFQPDTFSFGGQMGTGVLTLLGRGVENRYVRRGPTSYSIIGEAMFRPQSASEHAIPTSGCDLVLQAPIVIKCVGWVMYW